MSERRVLILSVVTDIHDIVVTYPSCRQCCSKLLVDTLTSRYHCIKCSVVSDYRKIQWRYRLVVSVSDRSTVGKLVVFGRTLDGFFGKSATDFKRSLDDLERTGYPSESLLLEALRKAFHGKYFYFGFKLTGSQHSNQSITLSDILKPDYQQSQGTSQQNESASFDNAHTLAYQMLASSEGVYATVTDYMRLGVKALRNLNKTGKISNEVHVDDQQKFHADQNGSSISKLKAELSMRFSRGQNVSSFYKTMSNSKQDSVLFSFENTSPYTDCSSDNVQCMSACTINSSHTDQSMNLSSSSRNFDISYDGCLSKLLHNVENTALGFMDNTSGRSLNKSKIHGNQEQYENESRNKQKDVRISPLSQLQITQQLDFIDLDESNITSTCKIIDKELKKRENLLSQKQDCLSYFTSTQTTQQCNGKCINSNNDCTNRKLILQNDLQTKSKMECATVEDVNDSNAELAELFDYITDDVFTQETDFVNQNKNYFNKSKLNRSEDAQKVKEFSMMQENHKNPNVDYLFTSMSEVSNAPSRSTALEISDLKEVHVEMPYSEGLETFFGSQFAEEIEMANTSNLPITGKMEEDPVEKVSYQHGNLLEHDKVIDDISKFESASSVESENENKMLTTECVIVFNGDDNSNNHDTTFKPSVEEFNLPESEDLEAFLDSFDNGIDLDEQLSNVNSSTDKSTNNAVSGEMSSENVTASNMTDKLRNEVSESRNENNKADNQTKEKTVIHSFTIELQDDKRTNLSKGDIIHSPKKDVIENELPNSEDLEEFLNDITDDFVGTEELHGAVKDCLEEETEMYVKQNESSKTDYNDTTDDANSSFDLDKYFAEISIPECKRQPSISNFKNWKTKENVGRLTSDEEAKDSGISVKSYDMSSNLRSSLLNSTDEDKQTTCNENNHEQILMKQPTDKSSDKFIKELAKSNNDRDGDVKINLNYGHEKRENSTELNHEVFKCPIESIQIQSNEEELDIDKTINIICNVSKDIKNLSESDMQINNAIVSDDSDIFGDTFNESGHSSNVKPVFSVGLLDKKNKFSQWNKINYEATHGSLKHSNKDKINIKNEVIQEENLFVHNKDKQSNSYMVDSVLSSAKTSDIRNKVSDENFPKQTTLAINEPSVYNGQTESEQSILKHKPKENYILQSKVISDSNKTFESPMMNTSEDLFNASISSNSICSHTSIALQHDGTPDWNGSVVLFGSDNAYFILDASTQGLPIDSSTPGLNDCIQESQGTEIDNTDIFDGDDDCLLIENETNKRKDKMRRVTFDRRIRRVSSCHLMDIKMRINSASPLLMENKAVVKPCIKLKGLAVENKVTESETGLPTVANNANVYQESKTDMDDKLRLNLDIVHIPDLHNINGNVNDDFEENDEKTINKSLVYSPIGSQDLFSPSPIIMRCNTKVNVGRQSNKLDKYEKNECKVTKNDHSIKKLPMDTVVHNVQNIDTVKTVDGPENKKVLSFVTRESICIPKTACSVDMSCDLWDDESDSFLVSVDIASLDKVPSPKCTKKIQKQFKVSISTKSTLASNDTETKCFIDSANECRKKKVANKRKETLQHVALHKINTKTEQETLADLADTTKQENFKENIPRHTCCELNTGGSPNGIRNSKRLVLQNLVNNSTDCDTNILSTSATKTVNCQKLINSPKGILLHERENDKKMPIFVEDSPDLFGDSRCNIDFDCDNEVRGNVPNNPSVLCKKLFF